MWTSWLFGQRAISAEQHHVSTQGIRDPFISETHKQEVHYRKYRRCVWSVEHHWVHMRNTVWLCLQAAQRHVVSLNRRCTRTEAFLPHNVANGVHVLVSRWVRRCICPSATLRVLKWAHFSECSFWEANKLNCAVSETTSVWLHHIRVRRYWSKQPNMALVSCS